MALRPATWQLAALGPMGAGLILSSAVVAPSIGRAVALAAGWLVLVGCIVFLTRRAVVAGIDARATQTAERYASLNESVPGVVYRCEVGDRWAVAHVGERIVELTGYTAAEWIANPRLWIELLHPDDVAGALADSAHGAACEPQRLDYRLLTRSGAYRWFRDDALIERDESGRPIARSGYLLDVTEQKVLEQQLLHQAFHDPLTGLANRALLIERIERGLATPAPEPLAVLYIDIDDLKAVNDSQGHTAGDDLLRHVADRIRSCARKGDTVARIGGDEFVFVLEGVDADRASDLADAVIDALRMPIILNGTAVVVSASIGVAIAADGDDGERLLQHADLAMYEAKRRGKGNVRFWSTALDGRASDRLDLRIGLGRALATGQLELFFQPIVALPGAEVSGLEALLRWNHPERGRLLPGQFLSAVHTRELAVRIGRWAVEEAARSLAELRHRTGTQELWVAVNLSPHELDQEDLGGLVLGALTRHDLEPRALVLEITEGTMVADIAAAAARLQPLRRAGVRVAIDDFGTGYSSLNYLGRLPADMLKIPRQFVESLPDDARTTRVVSKMVDLSTELGLEVVAEGIEHSTQVAALAAMGCRLGQGFHFASPCSLDEAAIRVARDRGVAATTELPRLPAA
jgi:diguanylate cyclase (GGDEF)-like protein